MTFAHFLTTHTSVWWFCWKCRNWQVPLFQKTWENALGQGWIVIGKSERWWQDGQSQRPRYLFLCLSHSVCSTILRSRVRLDSTRFRDKTQRQHVWRKGKRWVEALHSDETKQLIVLLGGYDEVQGSGNVYDRFLLNSRWQTAKIILTRRTAYLDQDQLMNDFTPPQLQAQIESVTRKSFVQRPWLDFLQQIVSVLCKSLLDLKSWV